jgi:hypothetical protein
MFTIITLIKCNFTRIWNTINPYLNVNCLCLEKKLMSNLFGCLIVSYLSVTLYYHFNAIIYYDRRKPKWFPTKVCGTCEASSFTRAYRSECGRSHVLLHNELLARRHLGDYHNFYHQVIGLLILVAMSVNTD